MASRQLKKQQIEKSLRVMDDRHALYHQGKSFSARDYFTLGISGTKYIVYDPTQVSAENIEFETPIFKADGGGPSAQSIISFVDDNSDVLDPGTKLNGRFIGSSAAKKADLADESAGGHPFQLSKNAGLHLVKIVNTDSVNEAMIEYNITFYEY